MGAWRQAVIFTLMASSFIGAIIGITLIAFGRRSTRLAYIPFLDGGGDLDFSA